MRRPATAPSGQQRSSIQPSTAIFSVAARLPSPLSVRSQCRQSRPSTAARSRSPSPTRSPSPPRSPGHIPVPWIPSCHSWHALHPPTRPDKTETAFPDELLMASCWFDASACNQMPPSKPGTGPLALIFSHYAHHRMVEEAKRLPNSTAGACTTLRHSSTIRSATPAVRLSKCNYTGRSAAAASPSAAVVATATRAFALSPPPSSPRAVAFPFSSSSASPSSTTRSSRGGARLQSMREMKSHLIAQPPSWGFPEVTFFCQDFGLLAPSCPSTTSPTAGARPTTSSFSSSSTAHASLSSTLGPSSPRSRSSLSPPRRVRGSSPPARAGKPPSADWGLGRASHASTLGLSREQLAAVFEKVQKNGRLEHAQFVEFLVGVALAMREHAAALKSPQSAAPCSASLSAFLFAAAEPLKLLIDHLGLSQQSTIERKLLSLMPIARYRDTHQLHRLHSHHKLLVHPGIFGFGKITLQQPEQLASSLRTSGSRSRSWRPRLVPTARSALGFLGGDKESAAAALTMPSFAAEAAADILPSSIQRGGEEDARFRPSTAPPRARLQPQLRSGTRARVRPGSAAPSRAPAFSPFDSSVASADPFATRPASASSLSASFRPASSAAPFWSQLQQQTPTDTFPLPERFCPPPPPPSPFPYLRAEECQQLRDALMQFDVTQPEEEWQRFSDLKLSLGRIKVEQSMLSRCRYRIVLLNSSLGAMSVRVHSVDLPFLKVFTKVTEAAPALEVCVHVQFNTAYCLQKYGHLASDARTLYLERRARRVAASRSVSRRALAQAQSVGSSPGSPRSLAARAGPLAGSGTYGSFADDDSSDDESSSEDSDSECDAVRVDQRGNIKIAVRMSDHRIVHDEIMLDIPVTATFVPVERVAD